MLFKFNNNISYEILPSHIFVQREQLYLCLRVNYIFYVFPCLAAGQKNHLRQEVLFVQTDAFRGENVKEGCFERKAPTEEKPQLTKRKAPNKEKTQFTQEKHPPQRNHTHKQNYCPKETARLERRKYSWKSCRCPTLKV